MSSLLWFWHKDSYTAAQSSEVVISLTTEAFYAPHSIPLPLPFSLPFSLPVLGRCQFSTPEAPLIAGKAPCMYNGNIYSKDDVCSPFEKPPWRVPAVGLVVSKAIQRIRTKSIIK
jgi:hypothetical protein